MIGKTSSPCLYLLIITLTHNLSECYTKFQASFVIQARFSSLAFLKPNTPFCFGLQTFSQLIKWILFLCSDVPYMNCLHILSIMAQIILGSLIGIVTKADLAKVTLPVRDKHMLLQPFNLFDSVNNILKFSCFASLIQ